MFATLVSATLVFVLSASGALAGFAISSPNLTEVRTGFVLQELLTKTDWFLTLFEWNFSALPHTFPGARLPNHTTWLLSPRMIRVTPFCTQMLLGRFYFRKLLIREIGLTLVTTMEQQWPGQTSLFLPEQKSFFLSLTPMTKRRGVVLCVSAGFANNRGRDADNFYFLSHTDHRSAWY